MNIAVIGISGVYPGADDLHQLHENLLHGVDSIRKVPDSRKEQLGLDPKVEYQEIGFLDEIACFDHGFFHIASKEADNMSPEQRIALEMAAKAVLDAGYSLQEFRGTNCGVFVASQDNDYYSMLAEKSGLAWIGSLKSMLAGKISYHLDLRGPNMVIDTGCSSGLVCIDDACRRLERGEIDCALVGGITIYLKFGTKNTDGDLLGIEAGDGRCKPFDAAADGIGVGEGGGFLLLKCLKEAERDLDHIYAVIRASAVNSDGARCNSITTPSIEGQKEAILRAWKEGGIHPQEVTEIEAHGTGTKLGDPIEVESFTESYQEYGSTGKKEPIYIGSIKGNIGHLNATAAIASVTKILLEFQHHVIYPLCHYSQANPLIDFESSPLQPAHGLMQIDSYAHRLVGANSFGLSGANAHIILGNYIPILGTGPVREHISEDEVMLKLSARSESSFFQYAKELEQYLMCHNMTEELVYTLNTGRDDYAYRKIIMGKNKEELIEQLRTIRPVSKQEERETIFVIKKIKNTETIQLCKEQAGQGPIEWSLYRYIKNLGIKSNLLLVDDYGKMIAEHADVEDWRSFDSASQTDSDLSEEEIIARFNSLCAQDKLDVIWIGDYEGRHACNTFIYCIRTKEDIKLLIRNFYEQGEFIHWKSFYEKKLRKVSAPAYCFEKNIHWGRMMKAQANAPAEEKKEEAAEVSEIKDIAATLKQIWIEVLECEEGEVEEDTDFFDLGGNSLLITLLVEEIEKVFGVELFVEEIYEYCTITQQKAAIEERLEKARETKQAKENKASAGIRKQETTEVKEYGLLPMQQLILNSIRRHPDKSAWNLTLTFKIAGPLEVEKMKQAYAMVCSNHDILRCRLVSKEGHDALQMNESAHTELTVIALKQARAEKAEQEVHAALKQDSLTPIDLNAGQLAEMKIYQIDDQTSYLLFKISHLITDGWSLNIIFDELCYYYANEKPRGKERRKFSDYVHYEKEYLKSEVGLKQVKYWENIVRKAQHLAVRQYEVPDSVVDLAYILINVTVLNQMRAFAKARKVSLFQIVLTIYHLTIQDFFGTKKSSIGVMTGNRNNMEYSNTAGLFARALLSTTETEDGEALGSVLQKVKKGSNQMLEQQTCSLGSMIGEEKGEIFEDFVDFLLTYQNFKNSDMVIAGLKFSAHMISEIEAICPMSILFYDSPQAMLGSVQYDPAYFSKQDVKEFIKRFHKNVQLLIQEER